MKPFSSNSNKFLKNLRKFLSIEKNWFNTFFFVSFRANKTSEQASNSLSLLNLSPVKKIYLVFGLLDHFGNQKLQKKVSANLKKKIVLFSIQFSRKYCPICLYFYGCQICLNYSFFRSFYQTTQKKDYKILKKKKLFVKFFSKTVVETICGTCTVAGYPCLASDFD